MRTNSLTIAASMCFVPVFGGCAASPSLKVMEPTDTPSESHSGAEESTTPPVDSPPDSDPPVVSAPRVFITEIMYHPVDEHSYDDVLEFVEIWNAGDEDVLLSGWQFDDGVSFAFGDEVLSAGAVWVVTGERDALLVAYPGLDPALVKGDWTGTLANGGERVRLVDADGETIDEVRYSDAAPWPMGADALGVGEEWLTTDVLPLSDHRGKGRSLQRVTIAEAADEAGAWIASDLDAMDPGVATHAMGAAGFAVATEWIWNGGTGGPLAPGGDIVLEVRVAGTLAGDPRIEWFVDDVSRGDEEVFTAVLMDDGTSPDALAGDNIWTAVLPAQSEGAILRARMWGDAGAGDAVVAPRAGDPMAFYGRYVGTPISGDTRAVQLFIDPVNWTAMWDGVAPGRVSGCSVTPGWEDRWPAVFVYGGEVADVWVRYQGSRWNRTNGANIYGWPVSGPDRPAPVKALSWSVKFPRYAPLDGQTHVSYNKLSQSCPGLNTMVGFALFEEVGLPVPLRQYTRMFINGAYYNYALEVERPGDDMLERWIAARAEAEPETFTETEMPHLFKSGGCNCDEGPFGWGDERPLTEYCGWSAQERYAATYERHTHDWDDYTELQTMIEGLDAARNADDATLRAFLDANFDVPSVLSYMAVMNWAVPFDDMFQNHFLVQRRSDGKWFMAPWDLDLNFGGWQGAWSSVYLGEEGNPHNRAGWWNRIKDSFFQVYRPEFDARLAELNATTLSASSVIARIDDTVALWSMAEISAAPAGPQCDYTAQAEAMRAFARERESVVLSVVGSP